MRKQKGFNQQAERGALRLGFGIVLRCFLRHLEEVEQRWLERVHGIGEVKIATGDELVGGDGRPVGARLGQVGGGQDPVIGSGSAARAGENEVGARECDRADLRRRR